MTQAASKPSKSLGWDTNNVQDAVVAESRLRLFMMPLRHLMARFDRIGSRYDGFSAFVDNATAKCIVAGDGTDLRSMAAPERNQRVFSATQEQAIRDPPSRRSWLLDTGDPHMKEMVSSKNSKQ